MSSTKKKKVHNLRSKVQSVIFSKAKGWNLTSAKKKFKEMDFTLLNEKLANGKFVRKKVDVVRSKETKKILQYRFRTADPTKFKRFITKKVNNGKILLIIGFA